MGNLITKYEEFIFEADSINTEISNTKLEISKVEDELKAAKMKMLDSKKLAKKWWSTAPAKRNSIHI